MICTGIEIEETVLLDRLHNTCCYGMFIITAKGRSNSFFSPLNVIIPHSWDHLCLSPFFQELPYVIIAGVLL